MIYQLTHLFAFLTPLNYYSCWDFTLQDQLSEVSLQEYFMTLLFVFSCNPSWKKNCSSYSCLSPAGFQFAGLVEEALGSALKKLNAAHSVRDHHTRAVAGATVRHGLNHFETIPTIEVEAATTNGELKHRGPSTRRWSTASALGRQKGARSAKE